MSDDVVDDPRAELALVEQELTQVTKEAEDLRTELGTRSDGTGDPVDQTTLVEQLNMNESLVDDLRRRRTELLRRIESAAGAQGDSPPG